MRLAGSTADVFAAVFGFALSDNYSGPRQSLDIGSPLLTESLALGLSHGSAARFIRTVAHMQHRGQVAMFTRSAAPVSSWVPEKRAMVVALGLVVG